MPRIQPGPKRRSPGKGKRDSTGWEGRQRLWVAVDGHNALGPGKIRLLEAIRATKSLSAAAKSLRMSYRLAWKHLQDLEQRIGISVVEPRRGGPGGGGTDLTSQGEALVKAYLAFRDELEEKTRIACRRHFARWSK